MDIFYNIELCIDLFIKNTKDASFETDDVPENLENEIEDINDSFLLETKVKRLKVILSEIPTVDKSLLLMKYQYDMSIKEMGETLDKSESELKMKIKRANHMFKNIYEEKFKTECLADNISLIIAGVILKFAVGFKLATKDSMSNFLAAYNTKGKFELGNM